MKGESEYMGLIKIHTAREVAVNIYLDLFRLTIKTLTQMENTCGILRWMRAPGNDSTPSRHIFAVYD